MKTGPGLLTQRCVPAQSSVRTVGLAAINSLFCPDEALKATPSVTPLFWGSHCRGLGPGPSRVAFLLVSEPPVSPCLGPPPFFHPNHDTPLSKGFQRLPVAHKPHLLGLTNKVLDSLYPPNPASALTAPSPHTPNSWHSQLLTRPQTSQTISSEPL